jgi:hypothetical protein
MDIVLFTMSLNLKSAIENPKSPNNLVRPRQYVRRNREADLFRGFQIDDQLELVRLLDRKIASLGTFCPTA